MYVTVSLRLCVPRAQRRRRYRQRAAARPARDDHWPRGHRVTGGGAHTPVSIGKAPFKFNSIIPLATMFEPLQTTIYFELWISFDQPIDDLS